MSIEDEALLSEESPVQDTSVDASVATNPEDFDFPAWLEGVRPTRRGVRLYSRADVIARLEQVADEIDAAPEGAAVNALIDEAEALQDTWRAGVVWVVVEKRSTEWLDDFRERGAKRLGVTLDGDGECDDKAKAQRLMFEQIAAQIVEPEGFTADHLERLYQANEGEVAKLMNVTRRVNSDLAESSSVVTRDFSQRRSTSPTTRRSSKH